MKLTQAERKALQESINHWQEDIINKFVGENSIARISSLYWKKSKKIVDCYSDSCPLCRKYFGILGYACMDCPYCKFYNKKCTFLHWRSFNEIPTKENAIAMRDSLQAILDSDKQNKLTICFKCGCIKIIEHRECSGYVADDDDIYGRCKFANQIQGNYAPKPFDCTNINLHQEYKIK